MPHIVASSNPPAAPAAAADSSSAPRPGIRRGERAGRASAFDDILNGARRRDAVPAPEAKPAEKAESARAEAAGKPRSAKPKDRPAAAGRRDREAVKSAKGEGAASAEPDAPAAADTVDPSDASAEPIENEAPSTLATHEGADRAPAATDPVVAAEVPPDVTAAMPTGIPLPTDAAAGDVAVAPPGDTAKPDPTLANPADVRADQPPPVLLGELPAAAQPAAHAATPTSGADATASELPVAMPNAVATPTRAAPAEQPAAQPATAPSGSAAADGPGVSSIGVAADPSLPMPLDGPAPDAAPSIATPQSAPMGDPTNVAVAAARVMETLAGHPVRETASGGAPGPANMQAVPAEVQFAEDNHPGIVSGIRGQLLPSGGTMQIRLDPPELGPLAVTIRLNDGVMEAAFETSNDQAAKLLSHSLSTLKASLESQGVSVERLHVQQAPKSESASQQGGGDARDQQQGGSRDPQQEHAARQEHQRREMLRRMWAKLRGSEDPLDMVA